MCFANCSAFVNLIVMLVISFLQLLYSLCFKVLNVEPISFMFVRLQVF